MVEEGREGGGVGCVTGSKVLVGDVETVLED